MLFLPLSFTACDAQSHSHAFLCPSTRETGRAELLLPRCAFRRRGREGPAHDHNLLLGMSKAVAQFSRDGRSSASFLSAPDLTDRGLAAFHKRRCSGCAQKGISFGTLLATDWSWTRHVVCGSAKLGTAGMAVRGAVLTSVSRSPSQATLYSRGPCMSTQFFLPSQWERFVEGCEDLLPTCKTSPR